jgi:hypothetical protein
LIGSTSNQNGHPLAYYSEYATKKEKKKKNYSSNNDDETTKTSILPEMVGADNATADY